MRFNCSNLIVISVCVLILSITPINAFQIEDSVHRSEYSMNNIENNYGYDSLNPNSNVSIPNPNSTSIESNEDENDEFNKEELVGTGQKVGYIATVVGVIVVMCLMMYLSSYCEQCIAAAAKVGGTVNIFVGMGRSLNYFIFVVLGLSYNFLL